LSKILKLIIVLAWFVHDPVALWHCMDHCYQIIAPWAFVIKSYTTSRCNEHLFQKNLSLGFSSCCCAT